MMNKYDFNVSDLERGIEASKVPQQVADGVSFEI